MLSLHLQFMQLILYCSPNVLWFTVVHPQNAHIVFHLLLNICIHFIILSHTGISYTIKWDSCTVTTIPTYTFEAHSRDHKHVSMKSPSNLFALHARDVAWIYEGRVSLRNLSSRICSLFLPLHPLSLNQKMIQYHLCLRLGILCNCIFCNANLLFAFKSLFLHFLPSY